jgi:hypothetical protein
MVEEARDWASTPLKLNSLAGITANRPARSGLAACGRGAVSVARKITGAEWTLIGEPNASRLIASPNNRKFMKNPPTGILM